LPPDVAAATSLSGREVWAMFAQAALWLRGNSARINAINVFPVPDGDTGSNMSATLDAAVDAATPPLPTASGVLSSMAHGALLGARGNSGVILSQVLAGFARAMETAIELDGAAFAIAILAAEQSARRAVAEPKPGTMLTVLADVAEAAGNRGAGVLREVLSAAVDAAKVSVARTPEFLPVLREAGVVDAGGLGLQIILEGCLFAIDGAELPPVPAGSTAGAQVNPAPTGEGREDSTRLGYCTEFLIHGSALVADELAAALRSIGDSVLAVGDEALVRVHVHTAAPGSALTIGTRHGELDRIKIDNIDLQQRMLAFASEQQDAGTICVVAIASGAGFEELFRGYGAIVVQGGQSANPSTAEILHALDRANCASVMLLPNDQNHIAAAKQAASLSVKAVSVLPTVSLPQGIAALLAFNPERSSKENEGIMQEAAARVHTIELTRAARSASLGGVQTIAGQPIGLLDGRLIASGETWPDLAMTAIMAIRSAYDTVTIFYGAEVTPAEAEAVMTSLRAGCSGVEVETLCGGQIAYPFIIAVE
jgi:DAK2 domain fusion protein YloV